MKELYLILLIFSANNLYSQNYEIAAFYNLNQLDIGKPLNHLSVLENVNNSFSIGIGISDLKLISKTSKDDISLDIMLSYIKFKGVSRVENGGLSGGSTTYGNISKHMLNFEFYPFHMRLFQKKFKLAFGGEYSRTIKGRIFGNGNFWRLPNTNDEFTFDYRNGSEINMNRFALLGKIEIRSLSIKSFKIWPFAVYSKGLTGEKNLGAKLQLNSFRFGIKTPINLVRK